jgi:aspartyl-tRNA(Asn)/glutamyl-tRNA(Gln) amidotransferase subunit A
VFEKTARELHELFVSGRASASEIVESFLARVRAVEPRIGAFVEVMEEEARRRAKQLDEKRSRGAPAGKLAGVVVAVKDNMCMRGAPATCSSRILKKYRPDYDATAVERLLAEDAVVIGKTNLDEFAMGSSTENSAFHPTRNPWNPELTPGGSSGGSAAAVSAGMAAAALGSDTGGSIRQPAFMTGTVGFKPTYGRVSRYGLVAFASSLDQIGPLATTVYDAALVTSAIAGHDPRDSTCASRPVEDFAAGLERDARGMRIGLPSEYFGEGVHPGIAALVEEALRRLEKKGAKLVPVELPRSRYGIATYYIVAPAEASSNLARYDGVHYGHRSESAADILSVYSRSRKEGFGPEVTRRIILGTFTLSSGYYDAYYQRALKVRRLIKEDFDRAFDTCDYVAGPTSPLPPFKIGEKVSDPLQMYLCDVYTVPTNLAGIPGISVPIGTLNGLPVGLQIQGRAFDDLGVLQAARAVERELGLAPLRPPLGS